MINNLNIDTFVSVLYGGGYPQYILDKSAEFNDDNETIQMEFYPLYNKILNYWFPPTEGYDVSPHWPVPGKIVDFIIAFVVEYRQQPLLLVEIMPPSDFQFKSGRNAALSQAIQHLDEIGPNNQHTDRLYAISAIGEKVEGMLCLEGIWQQWW